jgi:hypothetical protein
LKRQLVHRETFFVETLENRLLFHLDPLLRRCVVLRHGENNSKRFCLTQAKAIVATQIFLRDFATALRARENGVPPIY